MAFCETLKVLAEEYIERETPDCARNRNQFCSDFFTHLKTES